MADWRGTIGRHRVFPHWASFILVNPLRRLLMTPEEAAARLDVAEDARVLELGPGPGFFSVALARAVPEGHLELYDVQQEMLDKARQRLERADVAGVGYTLGDATDLPFDADSFDAAVLISVIGEVHDEASCLAGLRRVLRPGGLLSVTESLPDPDFHRFPTLRNQVEAAGFELERKYGRPWAYTANFRVPAT